MYVGTGVCVCVFILLVLQCLSVENFRMGVLGGKNRQLRIHLRISNVRISQGGFFVFLLLNVSTWIFLGRGGEK